MAGATRHLTLLKVAAIFLTYPLNELTFVSALSSPATAEASRVRLSQAFSSPSGKLTFSPELIINEPNDPTAILLQANAIQTLSERIRLGKANTAFVHGSLTALKTFTTEQEGARGNFPGPVPVIYYCGVPDSDNLQDIADAGADAVVVQVCEGRELSSPNEIGDTDDNWPKLCQAALEHGLQPIPELVIGEEAAGSFSGEAMESLVSNLMSSTSQEKPVAVLVTVNIAGGSDEGSTDKTEQLLTELPFIPKTLGKTTAILGSVCVPAGENRLHLESQRFKDAGYTGTLLRSDCVPGFRMNPDLNIVGNFWAYCIEDLKSTKSRSFSFRSKNNLDESAGTKWAKYQKGVLDSGALGDPNESYSVVDEKAGEYKGFA